MKFHLFFLVIGCIALWIPALVLKAKSKGKATNQEKKTPFQQRLARQQELMKELVTACGGDKAQAIRLIEYERNREPPLKTLEAIDRAAERLCRDRGRAKRG